MSYQSATTYDEKNVMEGKGRRALLKPEEEGLVSAHVCINYFQYTSKHVVLAVLGLVKLHYSCCMRIILSRHT